jgi:alkylhydroperoxidase family enzyme
MARLPYRDLETAPAETRTALAAFPPLNIFRMLAHAETLLRGFGMLGAAILGRSALDARLRELAILHVAARSPAAYEWQQHVPIARTTGATDAEITAIERGDLGASCFGARERALLHLADELLARPRAGDATLAAMRAHFSDREVCEAILTIGYYMMVARFLETTGVDLEHDSADTVTGMVDRLRRP